MKDSLLSPALVNPNLFFRLNDLWVHTRQSPIYEYQERSEKEKRFSSPKNPPLPSPFYRIRELENSLFQASWGNFTN